MRGKTHVAAGVATAVSASLAISLIFPESSISSGIIAAVAGGSLGGKISDIDCIGGDFEEFDIGGFIFSVLVAGIALCLDYLLGKGICAYILSAPKIIVVFGGVLFLGCCVLGIGSPHRTFTHSFLSGMVMILSLFFACKPLAFPFAMGFASHLLLDIFNQRGLCLFYPLKQRICANACDSNDITVNSVIFWLSLIIAIIAGVIYVMLPLLQQYNTSELLRVLQQAATLKLNYFQLYLIIINLVTIVALVIDNIVTGVLAVNDEAEEKINSIVNLLALIGGAPGGLLCLILLGQKLCKDTANWYAIEISFTVTWGVIYCIVCDPFDLGFGHIREGFLLRIILFSYIILINIISLILFIIDSNKFRPNWTHSEAFLFFIGLIGGTIGGLVSIIVTGKKAYSPHFSFGFPVMLAAQTFLVAYLLFAGVI